MLIQVPPCLRGVLCEIDLCLDDLAEILADIRQMKLTKVTKRAAVVKDKVDGKYGGVFELNDWVQNLDSRKPIESCNHKKTHVVLHVTWQKFVIYTVIYLIYIRPKSPW